MAGYIYILQDDNKKFYIGSTNNLNKRLQLHNIVHTQTTLNMKNQDEKNKKELELLKKACQDDPEDFEDNPKDFELIQELLTLQKNKSLLNKKRGLKEDIENRIEVYINAN